MANDVPADSVRDIPGGTLADGREVKIRVMSTGPDITVAILVRELNAADFHGIGARNYSSHDGALVERLLRTANLWDQSWEDLKTGGSYGGTSGDQAVSLRYADLVKDWTIRDLETATDKQWFHGEFIPFVQQLIDEAVAANPSTPLPPPVYNPFNPLGHVYQANTIALAQATRLRVEFGKVISISVP